MTFTTRQRSSFSWGGALVLILAVVLALPASAAHGPERLEFHQSQFIGMTAGELVEEGRVDNEVEGCGELAPGEVGWAFLVPGNATTNFFTHFEVDFEGDTQSWSLENDPGDATRVRKQRGSTTLLAFTTDAGNELTSLDVWGLQDDDRFVLTHVCVPDEPEGSILIEKQYEREPSARSEFRVHDDSGDLVGVMDATVVNATTVLYCLDELAFGDYTVKETVTPSGFTPADDVDVTVDTASTCEGRLASPDPDATIENPVAPVDLEVRKLKLSHDGETFVETDTPLAGFEYTLYEGPDDNGSVVATSTTGNDGYTDFADGILDVGQQYTVCETDVPTGQDGYWTAPSDHGYDDCETFTAELDEDVSLTFFNAPRADIDVGFTDVTGYASATIVCYDADGAEITSVTLSDTGQLDLDALDLGDYSCDIEIRNGGPDNGA